MSTHQNSYVIYMRSHMSFQCNRSVLETQMRSHLNFEWWFSHPPFVAHFTIYQNWSLLPACQATLETESHTQRQLYSRLESYRRSHTNEMSYETSYEFLTNYNYTGNLYVILYEYILLSKTSYENNMRSHMRSHM